MSVAQTDPNSGTDHIRRAIVIWIIASIAAILFSILALPHILDLPVSAAGRSDDINLTMVVFTAIAAPVAAGVVVFTLYSIFAFNNHGQPVVDAAPVHRNKRLQATWITASALLGVFLLGWGLYFLNRIDQPPKGNVLYVDVTGEQWEWNFTYPQYQNPSNKPGFGAQSTILEVPVNRPIQFTVTSIDVTHSFWIPSFAVKKSAVPGEWNKTTVTPNKMGTYAIRCMDLCGLYHAYMETQVKVVSTADFQSWVSGQPTGQYQLSYPSTSMTAPAPLQVANVDLKRPASY